MASELRVNTINSRTGFGTITVSETGQDLVGITTIENLTDENTLVGAAASFTGNVSIGGVLTYEDVTNIDSVGLITARQGIEIGTRPGVAASISVDGNMIVSGISTFGGAGSFGGSVRVGNNASFSAHTAADDLVVGAASGSNGMTILTGNATGSIFFNDGSGNDGVIQYVHSSSPNSMIINSSGNIEFDAGGSERVRIDSAGKVGIGEDNPTYNTEIKISSTDAYSASTLNNGQHQLRVNNAGAEGVAGILLTAEPSSGSAGHAGIRVVAPANGSADMTFSTRNAGTYGERLRIKYDGKIGIGGPSNTPPGTPDGNLHIQDGSAGSVTADTAGNIAVFEDSASNGISILVPNDERANIYFGTSGTGGQIEGGIQYAHESVSTAADRRDMIFRVGGGEKVRFQGTGGISFNGDSAAENALDDYEEGTANATFKGSEGGSTSLSNAVRYTKIGNQVHMVFAANSFANNGVGGTLEIGAPFTASDDFSICNWYGGDVYWYPSSVWDTYTDHCGFTPYISAGNAHINLKVKRKDEDRQMSLSASNNSQISGATGLYCRFSLTYTAA